MRRTNASPLIGLVLLLLAAALGLLAPQCPDDCRANADCEDSEFCKTDRAECNGTGTCEPMPTGCEEIYQPVCGCDDVTYDNECFANAAGVSASYDGECQYICYSNDECPDDLPFCLIPTGYCAGPEDNFGDCTEPPLGCPDNWDPVCGCDGITYSNECDAHMAMVSVLHAGECDPIGCTANSGCPDTAYCNKADGDCDGAGVCEARPAENECPDEDHLVCTCEGITRPNDCAAAAWGLNVAWEGECYTHPCRSNDDCVIGMCQKEYGDCGGEGVCYPYPGPCGNFGYDPVCGCDGTVYDNWCYCLWAGVNVDSYGYCAN